MTDIGATLTRMQKQIDALMRESRLSAASLDNTALEVRDSGGSVRALVGQQGDGTTAVNIVNGPTPPTPSAPVVAPALAALTVTWDGTFANAVASPLDWMRCEVHIGATSGFTPDQSTLRDTIETPQGGMVTIPLPYTEWFVKLRSRTSSGMASAPTIAVSATPRKAATADLTAGIITAELIAVDALTGKTITGGVITGSTVRTAATGTRLELDPDGVMRMFSGATAETSPGSLTTGITSDGSAMSYGYLSLRPPLHGSWTPPEFVMALGPEGDRQWRIGPLYLGEDDTQQTSGGTFVGDLVVTGGDLSCWSDATVDGVFTAGNIRAGHVTLVTTAANTPASITVTGLALTGTAFRAVASATTAAPGTQFLGLGVTNATANSIVIWGTRTNTTTASTGVDYIAVGV
ncbi:hypothetical protein ACWCPT_29885 [Streptomyces sp. NPDC002308]